MPAMPMRGLVITLVLLTDAGAGVFLAWLYLLACSITIEVLNGDSQQKCKSQEVVSDPMYMRTLKSQGACNNNNKYAFQSKLGACGDHLCVRALLGWKFGVPSMQWQALPPRTGKLQ